MEANLLDEMMYFMGYLDFYGWWAEEGGKWLQTLNWSAFELKCQIKEGIQILESKLIVNCE